jgi:hypothetical protein
MYRSDGITIGGGNAQIYGSYCIITGNCNVVYGKHCTVTGNYNLVQGKDCVVTGNNNNVLGKHCTITGFRNISCMACAAASRVVNAGSRCREHARGTGAMGMDADAFSKLIRERTRERVHARARERVHGRPVATPPRDPRPAATPSRSTPLRRGQRSKDDEIRELKNLVREIATASIEELANAWTEDRAIASTPVDKDSDRGMCVVCLERKASMAFIECGHMCICKVCDVSLEDDRCLMCRRTSTRMEIFST